MVDNDSSVKVDDSLIKRADEFVGPTKKYYFMKHFANSAFTELLEKLESKSK